jgi:hypothetical protein
VPPDASLGNPLAVALDKQVVIVFNKSDFGFGRRGFVGHCETSFDMPPDNSGDRRNIPDRISGCTFHNRRKPPILPKAGRRGRGPGGVARQLSQTGEAITRYA